MNVPSPLFFLVFNLIWLGLNLAALRWFGRRSAFHAFMTIVSGLFVAYYLGRVLS